MSFKTFIDRWINWGDSLPASPWQLSALFAVTVIIRNLMEAIPLGILFDGPAFLFHFPVAYVFPLLTLVFFMRVFSGYDTAKLLKIMVLAWTLTLLPPLIDGIIGHTSSIGYFPLERSNALWFLLNFFNPGVVLTGTTTGIRIEAALGCLLAGVFTWAVAPNRRLLRGVLNTIVFAPVFLSFFTWPYLVTIVFQPFFPGDGITHTLLQWHAGTEEALTGASHYITYLIDMIPVSLLSLWFLKELAPDRWRQLRNNLSWLVFPALSALTGTMAAFAIIPRAGITFADTVTIAGTFMACLWITAGSTWKGGFRGVSYAVALTLAWSAGWVTFVFAGLAVAVSGLPGPERMRRALFSSVLFITALSPAGFSLVAFSSIGAVGSIVLITVFSRRGRIPALFFILPMALLLAVPPASNKSAWIRGYERRTDSFSRSGRIALAMESASRLAGGGGSWLTLAQTTHMLGNNARSRYICETAMARGDSSTALMKVRMNLAFEEGDSEAFDRAFNIYMRNARPSDVHSAITMKVTFTALSGDTAALNDIHSSSGMNPMLLRSMASAYLVNGDTLRALQYSLAFLESPAAAAGDWAKTITLAAVTRQASYDSLYLEGEKRLGICIPIMLARLRAPVIAGDPPDRRDLLERCLLVKPDGAEVLETAALWYSVSDRPDSALIYGSRALAVASDPRQSLFALVINSALESGRVTEALAAAEYGGSLHPGNLEFAAIRAGILSARGHTDQTGGVPDIPRATALRDSIAEYVCGIED